MPVTVPAAFEVFRQNIEPSKYQREIASKRKNSLVSLLDNDFEILHAFATGSLPRFTAVRGYADLDIIVVLHYGKHIKDKKPSEVLQAVRDCLAEYRTIVRKNGQAVTLYYKTWPAVDIVPVSRTVNEDNSVKHYNIPDLNTQQWLKSQPVRHSNDMTEKNKAFGPEFKRIVKMIKWWNHKHGRYLQSYHIEVLALKSLSGKFGSYPWEVYHFFKNATELVRAQLWHNIGYVDSYLDWKKRQEALKRLETAREKAHDARYKTTGSSDDHEGAIDLWRQVFGKEDFPAYG